MKTPWSIKKIVTGSTLMFTGGVLFMKPNGMLSDMIGNLFGDSLFQLFIGIMMLVVGFVVFTKSQKLPKKQKEKRTYQKSKHELIEIFGLN